MFSNSIIDRRLIEATHADVLEWKRDSGETCADLAQAIGINPSTLAGYLNGHSPLPVGVLVRLCRVIGAHRTIEEMLALSAPSDDGECSLTDLLASVAQADEASSNARAAILKSLGDGKIDRHELAACEARLRDQHAAHRRLMSALRQHAKAPARGRRAPTLAQAERLAR